MSMCAERDVQCTQKRQPGDANIKTDKKRSFAILQASNTDRTRARRRWRAYYFVNGGHRNVNVHICAKLSVLFKWICNKDWKWSLLIRDTQCVRARDGANEEPETCNWFTEMRFSHTDSQPASQHWIKWSDTKYMEDLQCLSRVVAVKVILVHRNVHAASNALKIHNVEEKPKSKTIRHTNYSKLCKGLCLAHNSIGCSARFRFERVR